MYRRRGFTLIELLVVISVIVLLLVIFLPVVRVTKRHTKAAMCKVNLRQWGLVWSMYVEQNDLRFPLNSSVDPNSSKITAVDWRVTLENFYAHDSRVLLCPMTTKTYEEGERQAKYVVTVDNIWGKKSSYAANHWMFDRGLKVMAGTINPRAWATINVPNAYKVPVMGDSFLWLESYSDPNDTPPAFDGQGPNGKGLNGMRIHCIDRHNGGINILFMDWSVRKVGLKELWTLKWDRNFDTNGPWTKAGGVKPDDWPMWMRRFKDY